jgi:transposase
MLLLAEGERFNRVAARVGLGERHLRKWARRFIEQGVDGLHERPRPGKAPIFPPQIALYLVKMACELPDTQGRSLSQWDCTELARQVVVAGLVGSISAATVRRILKSHQLKPWQHHLWLSPKVPRDQAFVKSIREISRLYTRKLKPHERVLCLDEKTSLQPRPRQAVTLPPKPQSTMKVEHEYERKGALNLFAAFDTRTGQVWGQTYERKRQVELTGFLESLDTEIPANITHIHVVLDNLKMHKGKKVQAWLAQHPRFIFHFPPVHCSWMNQVEQWFSILQRKRLKIANFKDKQALAERLQAFIHEWNAVAHPFNWTTKSVAKVMAKYESKPTSAKAA